MHSTAFTLISLVLIVWSTYTFSPTSAGTCDSCGKECISLCGTRKFRICCMNYLKKRSITTPSVGDIRQEYMKGFPEVPEHYSYLFRFLNALDTPRYPVQDISDENENLKMLFNRPEVDRSKYAEPE